MSLISSTPQLKYLVIKEHLDQLILTLDSGDKLPSERDLASQLGCSFLTVRKALNLLSKEGRVIKRTGSGTFVADGMINGANHREDRVGLLLHAKGDAYGLRIAGLLTEEARKRQVNLVTKMVDQFGQQADAQISELIREGCSSVIVPWLPWDQSDDLAKLVKRSDLPICVPVLLPGLEEYCFERPTLFGQTTQQCVESAGAYFSELGYKQIAFVGPVSPEDTILQRKMMGYTNFVCRYGISDFRSHLVKSGSVAMDRLAAELTGLCPNLAIIAYDDTHAIRLLTAMHKLGRSAPDDFAILGYNDTDAALHSDPPLSSFYTRYEYVAHWLLRHALALSSDQADQATQSPPLYLHVRKTCGGQKRSASDLSELLNRLGLLESTSTSSTEVLS
jgi:DNA-binding LacI/PurR family transcriptional regulator/biotin operon repressor